MLEDSYMETVEEAWAQDTTKTRPIMKAPPRRPWKPWTMLWPAPKLTLCRVIRECWTTLRRDGTSKRERA